MKVTIGDYRHFQEESYEPLSDRKTKKAWTILLNKKGFAKRVSTFRKMYKIPTKGFNNSQFDNFLDSGEEFIKTTKDILAILEEFNLTPIRNWYFQVAFYLLTNQAYAPHLAEVYVGEEKIDGDRTLIIRVLNKMNKSEFFNFLNKRWKYISMVLNSMPIIKVKNIRILPIAKKVIELRGKKKTFSEIADILSGLYPDDYTGKFNEDYMKTIYHRYKKLLT